jgi:iron(III)-enterobactin esterase
MTRPHIVSRAAAVAIFLAGLALSVAADEQGAPGARGGRGRGGGESSAASILEDGDFTIRPPWANAPELIWDNSIPHGTIHRFTMKSEDSKIYKGISRDQPGAVVPYERPVAVYIPAQYVRGTPAPFIVVQDGYNPKYHLTVPTVLDTLIAQKKIPVMIAVLVQHGGGDGPGSERGLEYDTVSDAYTKFIETEVLPRIEKDYKVTLTKDPNGRATMGGSSGAACAFTMAWFHPELYSRVLSYSGTFVNQARPSTELAPHGAWEYHATFIPNSERKPIRVWLEVGEFDNGANRDESTFGNWIIANQHMAAALKAKGYTYRYVYAEGARHTDAGMILQTLPQALQWLWKDYPIK